MKPDTPLFTKSLLCTSASVYLCCPEKLPHTCAGASTRYQDLWVTRAIMMTVTMLVFQESCTASGIRTTTTERAKLPWTKQWTWCTADSSSPTSSELWASQRQRSGAASKRADYIRGPVEAPRCAKMRTGLDCDQLRKTVYGILRRKWRCWNRSEF